MVWRKVMAACVLIAALAALPQAATAAAPYTTAYDENFIYALDIARSISMGLNDSYVFYPAGDDRFCLVVGGLALEEDRIQSETEVTIYQISPGTGNVIISSADAFSIDLDSSLVYSNLGNLPDLIERTDYYAFTALLMLGTALCCYLLRSVFSFNLRNRR